MGQPIQRITLEGYRSIHSLRDFELKGVNVLIGANGCGKSNFVSFFHLLRELVEGRLERAVNLRGGADRQLYFGPKETAEIKATLEFGVNEYLVSLRPTVDNRLILAEERIRYNDPASGLPPVDRAISQGQHESQLKQEIADHTRNKLICEHIYGAISSWTVYHFHDTSDTAGMRRTGSVRDNLRLRPDAANLAAYLLWLREQHEGSYALIVETVRLVAPFFDDFTLRRRMTKDDELVQLEWKQQGSDYPFHPSQLSDGTLRFIALATALLQPEPPTTIVIDEPELGLHPYALDVLGNLILQAEARTQVIVSTQSAPLLNCFSPEHIVVVERHEGESAFRRLESEPLSAWLEDFTLSDLWQKNVYGGGPVHE